MVLDSSSDAVSLFQRLIDAWNAHDLEGYLACFDPDYDSRWPIHPERDFVGRENTRERWSHNFETMPDFRVELLGLAQAASGEVWIELRWRGTRPDGSRFDHQGVTINRITDGRIAAARLYLEPLDDVPQP
ncbi:MAG TPA: nuclear transport factor 2 family protein [Candidatus Limnocylindrales bacterium]|nr:nuclear transport factor 2 family protein [Candidatus Limnocylindrales bacterium]